MGEERSVGLRRVYVLMWHNGVVERVNFGTRPVRLCGKGRWWEGVGELTKVLEEEERREEEKKGDERKEERSKEEERRKEEERKE